MPRQLICLGILCLLFSLGATNALGQLYFSQAAEAHRNGDYLPALQANKKAIELFQNQSNRDSLVLAYVQQGNILWDFKGIKEALVLLDSAMLLADSYQVDPIVHISALDKKAQVLVHAGYWQEAKETFSKAENLIPAQAEPNQIIATLYNNISWLNLNLQQLSRAYDYAQKSLTIQTQLYGENDRKLMGVYQSLGLIANDMADFENAENYSLKLLEIAKTNLDSDHPTMALVQNQLAIIYEARFRYNEALKHMREMTRIAEINYKKNGNPNFLAIAYNNLGNLYHQLHEYPLAEPYFQKALDLHSYNYGTQDIGIIQPIVHLASTKTYLSKFEEADSLFFKAYQLQGILEKENTRGLADLETQLGDLYSLQERSEEAISWYRKSLQHYENSGIENHFMVQETKSSLATELSKSGKTDSAIVLQEEVLEAYTRDYPDAKIQLAVKINQLSRSLFRSHQLQKAQAYSDSAFAVLVSKEMLKQENWVKELPPSSAVADLIFLRIELLEELNIQSPAAATLEEIVSLADQYRLHFEKSIIGLRSQYSLIELAKKQRQILQKGMQAAYALAQTYHQEKFLQIAFQFSEIEKGVLLRLASNNLLVDHAKSRINPVLEKDRQWRETISQINASYLNSTTENDSLLNLLTQNLDDYASFQDSLVHADPSQWKAKFDLKPFTLEEIRSKLLGKELALVEYSVTDKEIFSFVLTETDFQVFRIEREAVISNLNSIQDLRILDANAFKKYSYGLFSMLLKPILSQIQGKNLLIVPDRELFSLNFEILLSDLEGEQFSEFNYLLKDYEISYLLSASTAPQFFPKNQKSNPNGLFMAPGFTQKMKWTSADSTVIPIQNQLIRQPFSLQAAQHAMGQMGGKLYQETEAQESSFKDFASDFGIIHLATHGEVDNQFPMQSRLFMAIPQLLDSNATDDGIIHAFEVYGMQLQAELAVLSACNTGVGKFQEGEGVVSLAHSFLYAGSSSVLMSLWGVDEKSSAEILQEFYKQLSEGKSKSSALRLAKLKFLATAPEELAHPYYWAGLGLIGDPSPITNQQTIWGFWCIGFVLLLGLLLFFIRRNKL
ncbi:CHAT domain-containing protein [Algoriphagus vanfongensis]|uniref:CHAT domain-containing protein n=1 Tax=Algoriphagus vanfongensis TaxID=426371 RepID=UPI00042A1846|nr:CHAT domain-containing protein [Algoriphagus vanfongensis]